MCGKYIFCQKGDKMRIDAINTGYGNTNQVRRQNFKGFWMRVGQNYLEPNMYGWGAFHCFTDGVHIRRHKDLLGRGLIELDNSGMTVKEGCAAFAALFEGKETTEGYNALKKLKAFIAPKTTKDGKHNVLYIEDIDMGDVTKPKHRIDIHDVEAKLNRFEKELGYGEKTSVEKIPVEPRKYPQTMEEVQKFLVENGIA